MQKETMETNSGGRIETSAFLVECHVLKPHMN
jgi:hypothetical protein